jgi:pyruvate formate lyase activating enzyme
MKEAMFYSTDPSGEVQCSLCHQSCKIKEGRKGLCGVRENRGGKLYTLVYGNLIAENIDPVEKKPLFHFLPGSTTYSIGTVGCNFLCKHCQNADISQYPQKEGGRMLGTTRTPRQVVDGAKNTGCSAIAYTYTEPTIFYEFAYDTCRVAQNEGLRNIFVSNGYMGGEAADQIIPHLDGINVDLKSFNDKTYRTVCGARLKPVLENIRRMKEQGVWVEVTTLIIPGVNDDEGEFRDIARFIADVSAEIPWHVSQFFPAYKMQAYESTPPETIHKARRIGMEEGLRYVYEGNLRGQGEENTYCPRCQTTLVERSGLRLITNRVTDGKCPDCSAHIEGVWV